MPNTDSVAVDSPKESGHCLLRSKGQLANPLVIGLGVHSAYAFSRDLQCPGPVSNTRL